MTKKAQSQKSKRNFFANLSVNFVLLATGLSLLIWAEQVTNIIAIILGVFLLIIAVYYYMTYFETRREKSAELSQLISAVFLAILGATLIFNSYIIKEFISFVVGAWLVVLGLITVSHAQALKLIDKKLFMRSFIFGIISTTAGALCIISRLIIPDLMLQILGAMMIIFSFSHTASNTIEHSQSRKSNKEKASDAIEAEIVDKTKH